MANIVEFILQLKDMMSSGMQRAATTAQSSLNRVTQTANRANNSVSGIGNAAQSASNRGQRSVAVLERALRMLENKRRLKIDDTALTTSYQKAQRLKAEIDRIKNVGAAPNVSALPNGGTGGGSGLAGMVKGGAIVYAVKEAVQMIAQAGAVTYGAAMGRRGVERAVNVTTGGQGESAVSQTRAITDKYGINFDASLEGVKTLTGGLMSMNMPLKEQMRIFEGVSTGVAALNLSADAAKGSFLALGQMASKGTVSAEELRGQLGERIPGAFGIAARAMGVTEAALGDMMQKGEIAASDFLPRFATEMQKTFGEDALKNANGPAAIQERFNNALADLKVTVGEGLIPVITPVLLMLTDVAQQVLPVISNLFSNISNVLPVIKESVSDILAPITGIKVNTEAWVPQLDVVRVYFNQVKDTVKQVFSTVFSIVGGVVKWLSNSQILKDVFTHIANFATVVMGIIEGIAAILKGIFENVVVPILNGIESAYRFLTGAKSLSQELTAQKAAEDQSFNNELKTIELARHRKNYEDVMVGINAKIDSKNKAGGSALSISGGSKKKGDGLGSKGVTHQGPKVITINFNKEFIGDLAINSYNIKEGVGEMEDRIREAVYRIFYSLETQNA